MSRKALLSGVYDMAVLDVMMPEMNGFEVARRARKKAFIDELRTKNGNLEIALLPWTEEQAQL